MKRLLTLCAVPLLLAACSGPSTPAVDVNKQQTERLRGTWTFSYTLGGDRFSNAYSLTSLNASTTPGEYYLAGTDEQGNVVVAGYNSEDRDFSLLDREAGFERFFVFDLTSDTSAEGCYFQVNMASNFISECYAMTGTRTSAAALSTPKVVQERMRPPSATNGAATLQKYRSLRPLLD